MVLMSTVDALEVGTTYPELAGKRVLLTGLTAEFGPAIVRAFAAQRTRLALHVTGDGAAVAGAMDAAAEALDAHAISGTTATAMDIARLVRGAIAKLGGIDAVVNIVTIMPPAAARRAVTGNPNARMQPGATTSMDVEGIVADALRAPCLASRIAANRMRLTWTRGSIVNVLAPAPATGPARIIADMVRASLAAMTRIEAAQWAREGISINAIATESDHPDADPTAASATDVASFAVHLASRREHDLSGLVFAAPAELA